MSSSAGVRNRATSEAASTRERFERRTRAGGRTTGTRRRRQRRRAPRRGGSTRARTAATTSQIPVAGHAHLAPQDEEEYRKQREREDLSAHDQERGGRPDCDQHQDEGRRRVGHIITPHVEGDEAEREGYRTDESEHEAAVAEAGFERVEDKLAEDGNVRPSVRRRGGIRHAWRDVAELHDPAAERSEPVSIGADGRHQGTERGHERSDEPRQPRRVRGKRVHRASIGSKAAFLQDQRSKRAAWPWPTPTHSVARP